MLSVFPQRSVVRGFTLVEALVVVAIMVGIAAWLYPVSTTIQSKRDLEAVADEVVQTLREAQANAVLGAQAQRWGVYFDPDPGSVNDRFILFAGSSYVARDTAFDLSHALPDTLSLASLSFTGGNAVIFDPVKGTTSNSGSLQLTSTNGESLTISVNAAGTVEVE